MAENVITAIQKAYAEYLHIAELFRYGDSSAEFLWQKFCHAENGFSLAMVAINNPEIIAEN